MPAEWHQPDQAILCTYSILKPWGSVYSFSTAAAQLAANQKLLLHCREDEVLSLLERLNALLNCRQALNRAYLQLLLLEKATVKKLICLLEREKQLVEARHNTNTLQVESAPVDSGQAQFKNKLEQFLIPQNSFHEIAGLKKMLTRLEQWLPALNQVKEQGFHVIALDRRRQPYRPALEARRYDPILLDGTASALQAGYLQPIRHHQTLWAYLIVRSDTGQSVLWN